MRRVLKRLRYIIIALLCLPSALAAQGDDLSNWRAKTLVISKSAPFRLDSLTVLPASIEVFAPLTGERLGAENYEFRYGEFTWKRQPLPDTIDIRYQVMAVDLSVSISRLDTQYIKVDPTAPPDYIYNPFDNGQSGGGLFDADGLDYSGSFARGISFGNNQSLVLNSSFNLQMSGDLGDDIEILAAISDQNIPLQPEGNTQNIQDFDRVFIQLKKGRSSLIAGDYDLRRPSGYFMNYNKKLKGANFTSVSEALGGEWKNTGAFAVSGGKFARQTLANTEGNQGPYKLRGNNNELFIIVLSGTEKIYWDGELLERGENNDYIVDYNRGEVTFTPRRLVTKDSRIIVEFEYTDQNYLRFLYTLGTEYKKGKWSGRVHFYNEQDSKNSSGQQELSEAQLQALAAAGDNLDFITGSGVDTLEEFSADRIAYKQVDSLHNGILYPDILIYSMHPDSARFSARFTEVGQGQGNYISSGNAANGRVYVWVAPDAEGVPQGNFEPVVKLVAPIKQQLLTFGGRYDIAPESFLDVEGALSNRDLNRFSDLDAQDNIGTAVRLDYQRVYKIGGEKKNKWKISTKGAYEFAHRHFQSLSPYRPAEFARDWNTATTGNAADQHLAQAGLGMNRLGWGRADYGFSTLLSGAYQGYKHSLTGNFNRKGYRMALSGSYLNTESAEERTRFLRPRGDISKTFKWKGLRVGTRGEQERNARQTLGSDSLSQNSRRFDVLGGYLETTDSGKAGFSASYRRRWDYLPSGKSFVTTAQADEARLGGNWTPSSVSRLKWDFTYRKLAFKDSLPAGQEEGDTYLGRLEHQLNWNKGLARLSTLYELGSGQEPELEFVYQQVNDGEGVYMWIDRNEDGVAQLDEFEVAVFQDQAQYIRVATFSGRYVRSNKTQFNHTLSLNPKAIWYKERDNPKAFLAKFALQSAVKINRRVRLHEGVSQWNPFELNIPDTTLVSLGAVYRATLYFNRSDPKYDARIGTNNTRNRSILTTGFESRAVSERFVGGRWNVTKKWTLSALLTEGWRLSDSEFFDNKDYQVRFYETETKLSYQHNQGLRLTTAYEFGKGRNNIGQLEKIQEHDFSTELTYNRSSKTSIRMKGSFIKVDFTGEANTPVGFALLQGLRDGLNYLWNVSFDRKLSKNLIMSLSYEGRKTGDSNMAHLGRASMRASF